MIEFFNSLETMQQVYAVIAAAASIVFVIQAVILVLGFDTDADMSGGDVDFDVDGMHIVSVKTIVCFLLGFGWTGFLFYKDIDSPATLALLAFGVGLVFMFLIAVLIRQVMRLSRDNTFSTKKVVGSVAEVYLRIPGGGESGKIIVSHESSTHELLAFAEEEIPTGAKVRITEAVDESSVKVEVL